MLFFLWLGRPLRLILSIQNALYDAVIDDDLVIIKKLLKKRGDDIDVNAVDGDGDSLLYNASHKGSIGTVKLLIRRCCYCSCYCNCWNRIGKDKCYAYRIKIWCSKNLLCSTMLICGCFSKFKNRPH